MAYETKYLSTWKSYDGTSGVVTIQEKDYAGAVIPITLKGNAANIANVFDGWESPVVGKRCKLNIINDKDDYFELFELLTATEGQFKVIVLSNEPSTLFTGFIDTRATTHNYLRFGVMKIVASSYMSKLKFIYPTSIDTLQNVTFINLINEILVSLGVDYDIRVNCKLYAVGDTLGVGQTLFNKNGIATEVFWKNDVDRDNSFEILNKILVPLNCFLYWYEGYWYIDHYTDMWNTSIDYVEYTTGSSYAPTDSGSVVNVSKAISDVHDLVFINTSQTVKVSPGNRLIQLRFDSSESLLLNLLAALPWNENPTITNIPVPYTEYPNPDVREWLFLSQNSNLPIDWTFSGANYLTIANSVMRTHAYDTRNMGLLLATAFTSTVVYNATTKAGTKITLEFRYNDGDGEIGTLDPSDLENYYFEFGIVLSFYEGATEKYIVMKPAAVASGGEDTWYVTTQILSAHTWRPKTIVEASQFDKNNNGCDVSIPVSLADVASTEGGTDRYLIDNDIQKFNMTLTGEKLWKRFKSSDSDRNLSRKCNFGDFKMSVSNDLDFNLLEGSINTDFLNKKEIAIAMADNANLNYTNGILRGDDLDVRTTEWTRDAITEMPLMDWLMTEKFRIYNSTKQAIVSKIKQIASFRPFSLYTESKQSDKKFVLTNTSYFPSVSEGEVTLEEYDNDTVINLIEG